MKEVASIRKDTALNQWLEQVSRKQKIDYVFELEMWIKCFDRFFRAKNQPSPDGEVKHFLLKDFREELAVVRDVTLRMSFLASQIMNQERSNLLQFDRYLHNYLKRDYVMDDFCNRILAQPTPDDSLALLLDALNDLRSIIDELVKLPEVTFQTFTAMGKLINREIKQCRYIEMLVAFKFKVQYDRVDISAIATLIKSIRHEGLRQDVAKVFLELFRMLRYLEFVEKDLAFDRPLKNSLLIFSLINSELQVLFDFIENRVCKNPEISPNTTEGLDATIFACSQETKKVFSHELVGLVYLRQVPPIYAKVENSHGLLKNSLQHSIVQIAQAFDPEFDGKKLFSTLITRLEQSKRLISEIANLASYIADHEKKADHQSVPALMKSVEDFRESTMKYLMYKDWEEYENFIEEITSSKTSESLRFALHRFRIFLGTLSGEVGKRSVLKPALGA
jgi:ribosomal protein S15P/S13E